MATTLDIGHRGDDDDEIAAPKKSKEKKETLAGVKPRKQAEAAPDKAKWVAPLTDVVAPEFESNRYSDGYLEFHILVRLILSTDLRPKVWPRLLAAHFATESAHAMYVRLRTLLMSGREWPSLAVFAKDPALPHEAVSQLEGLLSRIDRGLPLTHGSIEIAGQPVSMEADSDYEGYVFDVLDAYRIARTSAESYIEALKAAGDDESRDPLKLPGIFEAASLKALSAKAAESLGETSLIFGDGATEDDEATQAKRVEALFGKGHISWPTGFYQLDEKSGGFHPSEVVLLGSTSGGGKTSMMLSFMKNLALGGTKVAMVELELDNIQHDERLSANLASVNSHDIIGNRCTDKQTARIKSKWDAFNKKLKEVKSRYAVYTPTSATISDCEMLLKQYDYNVWFIDYVNLLKEVNEGGEDGGWQRLSKAVIEFKRLAKKYKVCIVLAIQVAFDPETGQVTVRYAKAMVDHVDRVMVWYNPPENRKDPVVWIQHLKARQYEPFSFAVKMELEYCRFVSFAPGEIPEKDTRKLSGKRDEAKQEPAKKVAFTMKTQALPPAPASTVDTPPKPAQTAPAPTVAPKPVQLIGKDITPATRSAPKKQRIILDDDEDKYNDIDGV